MDGIAPAVVMINTKYPANAGRALRNCAHFGVDQLWITGERWAQPLISRKGGRLPREERMTGYRSKVQVIAHDDPLRQFERGMFTPVAVEVMPGAEPITDFVFPDDPVFVFGPEDGSLPDWARRNCHRHLWIPGDGCLNLADAVGIVLAFWKVDRIRRGLEPRSLPGENRGFIDLPADPIEELVS